MSSEKAEKMSIFFFPMTWIGFGCGVMFGASMTHNKPAYVVWIMTGLGLCCILLGFAMIRQMRKKAEKDADAGETPDEGA